MSIVPRFLEANERYAATFTEGDLGQSVRDDIAAIHRSPFILPETSVTGFIDDVRTGRLSQVE